jgi:O-antigen/teichoic acid export membrane protein
LVPKHGAVGYAASLALAYAISTLLSVAVLYRNYPEMMRRVRWGRLALVSLSSFAVCVLGSLSLAFAWAVGLGILTALAFVALILNSFRDDLSLLRKEF